MKRKLTLIFISAVAVIASAGASAQDDSGAGDEGVGENESASATARALEALTAAYNDLTRRVDEESGEAVDWAQGDIENLGDWEYRIVDLEGGVAAELEAELNRLGNERWEAYWVDGSNDGVRIYLKRPSISYLSRVPLSALLRMVAGGAQ